MLFLSRGEKRMAEIEVTYFEKLKMAEFSRNTAVLRKLSEEGDPFIRAVIAQNEDTPISLFKELSKDKDACVRLAVAENSYAPPKVLDSLSQDENQEVREAVYLNRNTKEETLKKMEEENEELVKDLKNYKERILYLKDNPSYR